MENCCVRLTADGSENIAGAAFRRPAIEKLPEITVVLV